MCAFEVLGGAGALEKPRSSQGRSLPGAELSTPFLLPILAPPTLGDRALPSHPASGQAGTTEWMETETKTGLCPWRVQTLGLASWQGTCPQGPPPDPALGL